MKIKFFLTSIMVAVFSNAGYAKDVQTACEKASNNISEIVLQYARGEISKEDVIKRADKEVNFSKSILF